MRFKVAFFFFPFHFPGFECSESHELLPSPEIYFVCGREKEGGGMVGH